MSPECYTQPLEESYWEMTLHVNPYSQLTLNKRMNCPDLTSVNRQNCRDTFLFTSGQDLWVSGNTIQGLHMDRVFVKAFYELLNSELGDLVLLGTEWCDFLLPSFILGGVRWAF